MKIDFKDFLLHWENKRGGVGEIGLHSTKLYESTWKWEEKREVLRVREEIRASSGREESTIEMWGQGRFVVILGVDKALVLANVWENLPKYVLYNECGYVLVFLEWYVICMRMWFLGLWYDVYHDCDGVPLSW